MRSMIGRWLGLDRMRSASIVTLSHAFIGGALFLQMIVLARILPAVEFGRLATALAIGAVFDAAINARGTETSIAIFVEHQREPLATRQFIARRLFRIDLLWNGSLYLLLGLGVLALDQFRGTDSSLLLLIMLAGFAAFPWGTTKGFITVFLNPSRFALAEMSYAATSLFAGCGLAYLLGAPGFSIGLIAAVLLRNLFSIRAIGFRLRAPDASSDIAWEIDRKTLVWFGTTGTLRAGLLNFIAQIDLLVLAAFTAPALVGPYRVAKTIAGLAQRATQPVWLVLKRRIIAGTFEEDGQHSIRLVVITASLFSLAGAVVLPPLLIFGEELISLTFGEQYRAAGTLLWWLLPGTWIMCGVTGWSGLFGSVSRKRTQIISLYVLQVVAFGAIVALAGTTAETIAMAIAISQVMTAVGFWILFLSRTKRKDVTELAEDA